MADRTKIAWADATWNPIVGCSPAGEGCVNCYARTMAARLARMPMTSQLYRGVVCGGKWNGTISIAHADTWRKPLSWRKPRRIFVCSMGDLFHPEVPRGAIKSVSGMAVDCPQHTFLWLTKRPGRMAQYTQDDPPPPNVWCGASVSTAAEARVVIPVIRGVRAGIRWLSAEPMIDDITDGMPPLRGIDWIVIGCESGPRRRPFALDWARRLRDRASNERIPVFVKQLPVDHRVSRNQAEWPEDLRVQEWPRSDKSDTP